jgi:GNAT superfamily N-acetyltransferase
MAEIEIRQAQPTDRAAVLAFCEQTWEWGDYIDDVWEKWQEDPSGLLLVALSANQPVGIVHIQMLNATEAWLEGMRVNPTYRRQGIARQLHLEAMAEAMRRGATTARLLTASDNTASIHLIEQLHFQRVGAFETSTATSLTRIPEHNTGLDQLTLATPADLDEIIDYLNVSNTFPATGGLYYAGFIGYSISDMLLREKAEAGQIYLLRRWERLDGLAIAEQRTVYGQKHLFIGYIDGTTESVSLIAYTLRLKLSEMALGEVRTNVPDLMMLHDAFAGAEYEWDGHTFYTYERSLI